MNNLVEIQNGKVVVSSLQVAERFEKRHDNVMEAIRNLVDQDAEIGVLNFQETPYTHPQNKQEYPMYLMDRDGFSLLVMGFTGSEALQWKKQFLKAFNEMESQLKLKAPSTLKEALILALQQQEQIELLETKVCEDSPKVETFDDFMDCGQLHTLASTADLLGIGRSTMNRTLRENGILGSQDGVNRPYRKYTKNGVFVVKEQKLKNGSFYPQIYVTPKGLDFLNKFFKTLK